MDTMQAYGQGPATPPLIRRIVPVLWAIVILSVVFAGLIFVIPLDSYRLAGNTLEVMVALFCMGCCLYAYCTGYCRVFLLLAAFAFFSYALSTTFWYLYSITFGRLSVFTTVSELGFLCFFLFFIAAISLEFRDEGLNRSRSGALLLLFLAIPVIALWAGGDHQPLRVALLFISFVIIEQLIATSIRYGVYRYPVLWAGICLRCLGWMIYYVRESIFTVYPVPLASDLTPSLLTLYDLMSLVGPVIIGSMALMQIGIFSYLAESSASPEKC